MKSPFGSVQVRPLVRFVVTGLTGPRRRAGQLLDVAAQARLERRPAVAEEIVRARRGAATDRAIARPSCRGTSGRPERTVRRLHQIRIVGREIVIADPGVDGKAADRPLVLGKDRELGVQAERIE